MSENPISIDLIALGNSSVGKTSYLVRIAENKFSPTFPTNGYDIKFQIIELENGKKVNVKFYDTSGQERYHSLSANFIKNADGIVLMYDITNRESFDTISRWWNNILEHKEKDFPVILVGNKCDLEDERKVQKEEGEKIAKEYNVKFYEASNKDGINVEESFRELINIILGRMPDHIKKIKTTKKNQLSKEKLKKRSCFFSRIKC